MNFPNEIHYVLLRDSCLVNVSWIIQRVAGHSDTESYWQAGWDQSRPRDNRGQRLCPAPKDGQPTLGSPSHPRPHNRGRTRERGWLNYTGDGQPSQLSLTSMSPYKGRSENPRNVCRRTNLQNQTVYRKENNPPSSNKPVGIQVIQSPVLREHVTNTKHTHTHRERFSSFLHFKHSTWSYFYTWSVEKHQSD